MELSGLLTSLPLVAVVLGVFALTAGAGLLLAAPAETPAARLSRYTQRHTAPGAMVETLGLADRLVKPLVQRLLTLLGSITPTRVRDGTAAQLAMAGSSMSPAVFLAIRTIVMFGLPLLALFQLLRSGTLGEPLGLVVLGLSVIWGRRLPSMWLRRKIRARQRSIDRELPYALDLLVACLEGGLSLDASLAKVAEQSAGPLAEEIKKTLQEIALGRPSIDALRQLGERTGAPDLKQLTANVALAERMGIGIAGTLRVLARESRVRRRQRAEEMARKAPIKMIPVLVFFVLPSLAIVIMAPAAIIIMRVFGNAG